VNPLVWLALKGFLACLILTPIFRDVFRHYGVVDQPDRNRKLHVYPIPRIGGIPIALAYAFSLYSFSDQVTPLTEYRTLAWKLVPAAVLVLATGLTDDLFGLKPWHKLAGQVGAAGLAYWAGVRVFGVAGYIGAAWWSFPLTILWLLVCANAFNLVDGLDGLAAGMGLVAALTISVAALMNGLTPLAYVSIPLAGVLVGFLCHNFNPATVFLGDSGSLLIGFLLGCYGAIWTQKSATLISITVPLLALAIPMLDVLLAILRRFLRNQPIFSADRRHIHHRLLDRGMTPRRAVLVLYLVCAMAAAFGLLLTLPYAGRYVGFVILTVCAVALFGIRELRYTEFGLATRLLFGGEFQRTLGAQIRLERLVEDFVKAQDEEECSRLLIANARDFGFCEVRIHLRGKKYSEVLTSLPNDDCWRIHIRVGDQDSVELSRPYDSGVLPMMVGTFVDSIRRALERKLEKWDQVSSVHQGVP
jgi:UDP-GlcNAc:undecaprenyl-phosphate GlcNAc-1-phosphate transferase